MQFTVCGQMILYKGKKKFSEARVINIFNKWFWNSWTKDIQVSYKDHVQKEKK